MKVINVAPKPFAEWGNFYLHPDMWLCHGPLPTSQQYWLIAIKLDTHNQVTSYELRVFTGRTQHNWTQLDITEAPAHIKQALQQNRWYQQWLHAPAATARALFEHESQREGRSAKAGV